MATIPGRYGVDAPLVPVTFLGAALLAGLLALTLTGGNRYLFSALAALAVLSALWYLYASRRGKFRVWRRIIGRLGLTGNERVLDVGCGRGMVVITAARALPDGQLVGVDLWRTQDQLGNAQRAAMANAERAGVSGKVRFRTANMTALPFPDGSFDVVVSHLAMHHLRDRLMRATALAEMLRVTRPGGKLRITDVRFVDEYVEDLRASGAAGVTVTRLGPSGWYGGPFRATRLLSATRPP